VDTDYIHIDYPDAFVLMEHLASMGENCANLHKKVRRRTSRCALRGLCCWHGWHGWHGWHCCLAH
jgi:hypothetical protein